MKKVVFSIILNFFICNSVLSAETPKNKDLSINQEIVKNYTSAIDTCALNFNVECVIKKSNGELLGAPIWMKKRIFI